MLRDHIRITSAKNVGNQNRFSLALRVGAGGGEVRLIKHHGSRPRDFLRKYVPLGSRIVNLGSAGVRFEGYDCTNVDIQAKEGVDVVADIQYVDLTINWFDAALCVAALQYCKHPLRVADSIWRSLRPGGYAFIDAPWCQPYCSDTPDLLRFSADYLRDLFNSFEIIELCPSITSGSAFYHLGVDIASNLSQNRYVSYLASKSAEVALTPFKWVTTTDESRTCGAFYLIAMKC